MENVIESIYNEREQFILIGLTGRTGSGCSTVSKILSEEDFRKLKLHKPKETDFDNNDERKYQIIYRYAEKHWDSFMRISMTDMIFSYIVQNDYNTFIAELKKILGNDVVKQIQDELDRNYNSIEFYTIDREFNSLNEKISSCLDENKKGLLRTKEVYDVEREILNRLPNLHARFREVMKEISFKIDEDHKVNTFTYCLQVFGNRIRHHGDILESKDFNCECIFALARRANDFIKVVRHFNKKEHKPTFICLDAIRNPYEATYFQDRYASFYLVSVSTDDDERKRRLSYNFDAQQIKSLDDTEYPKHPKGVDAFINQNIGACAQLADIYLYNPRENTEEKYFITELVVKYITLIKHPGLVTPSNVERCMQIAYNAKFNSGCLSRQVGAVITDQYYSVKAVGWNSAAEGQVPCNLRSVDNYINNKDRDSFSQYEIENEDFNNIIKTKYSEIADCNSDECRRLNGRLFSYCFKDEYGEQTGQKNQVHTRSLHAEENAFLQIVKYGGEGIKGGNLFTSASSCVLCSKKAFQLGIKHIYYIDPYTDIANSHILSFGKYKEGCPQCHLFYGAIGKAYTCLFTQRIAIKDELRQLLDQDNK